jgi:hypothetical protein
MREFQMNPSGRIFILGSPRSGTSSLLRLIKDSFEVSSDSEGHLLSLLPALDEVLENHWHARGLEADDSDTDLNTLSRIGLASIRSAIHFAVASRLPPSGEGVWVDKTPGRQMILAAPAIYRSVWPAKFIFLYRNGVHNIDSRLRKFPEAPFSLHCRQWVETMAAWQHVKQSLPAEAYIEIGLHDLVARPREILAQIAQLTGLTPSGALPEALPEIERTSNPNQIINWTERQKATFQRLCASTMADFGLPTVFNTPAYQAENGLLPLSAPVGQVGVRVQAHDPRFVSTLLLDDGWEFFTHIGAPDQVKTEITYADMPVERLSSFETGVRLAKNFKHQARFGLEIVPNDRATPGQTETIVLSGGESRTWRFDLAPFSGPANVTLSVELHEADSNNDGWAYWLAPAFQE